MARRKAYLDINGNLIENSKLISIELSNPIIDSVSDMFYIGTFISQKMTITFKNIDDLELSSGQEANLTISEFDDNGVETQYKIGQFLIDDLSENYYKKNQVVCLDYASKFIPAVGKEIENVMREGITLENLLIWLCYRYNVTLGTYPETNKDIVVGNYDSTMSGKLYISYIAELMGGNAKFDKNGVLNIIPAKQPIKKNINIRKGKKFEVGEKIKITKVSYIDAVRNYTKGDDTGNTLYIRQDNIFVVSEQQIENIYNAVNGLELYSLAWETGETDLTLSSTDILGYSDGTNVYNSYYNADITYKMSLLTKVKVQIPTKQQENTTNVIGGNIETRMRKVLANINTLTGEIELLSKKVVDLSNEVNGYGQINITNAHAGRLHKLTIKGDISLVFPSHDLYPSNDLYPLGSYLLVDETKYKLDIDYLNFISQTICDEYVYEDGKQSIIRRVGIDAEGNKYELENEIVEERQDLDIFVSTNSTIRMESFTDVTLYSQYLLKNDYTSFFTTIYDVESSIKIEDDKITQKVQGVSDENGLITSASIILALNKDMSTALINADKISLRGKTLDLTGDVITILSDNFSVDNTGKIKATAGEIADFSINKDGGFIYEIFAPYDYTQEDLNIIVQIINQQLTPTQEQITRYDLNKDGQITTLDLIMIRWYVDLGITTTRSGKYVIQPPQNYSLSKAMAGFKNANDELRSGFTFNRGVFPNLTVSGDATLGNLDSGVCSLTSAGDTVVYFNKTFSSPPNVVLTAKTTTNGVISAKISEITTTYFRANIGGTGFGYNDFCWIATL